MSDDSAVQRTLVLLKPDAVSRGLIGRVLARFEDALLKVVAAKMVLMDADLTRRHYFDLEERFGADAEAQIANRLELAKVGIPLTLSAIKKDAESQ